MHKWHAISEADDASDFAAGPAPFGREDIARHLADTEKLERKLEVLRGRGRARDIEAAARAAGRGRGRAARRRPALSSAVAFAASLALAVFGADRYRNEIVSAVPQVAALYEMVGAPVNIRGMEFVNIAVAREYDNGLPVIAVRGEIVNVAGKAMSVPRLRFGLRDAAAQEIYYWTVAVGDSHLEVDARTAFVTKLATPPPEARDVVVRFQDLSAKRASSAPL